MCKHPKNYACVTTCPNHVFFGPTRPTTLCMVDRRTILKGAGGIAGLGIAGIGASAFTGSAVAANLNITDPSTVTTDDGQIQFVNVALTHTAEWDGFDRPVDAVAYRDRVIIRPQSDNKDYVVYDNTNNPVLLDNYSSQNGSDGWGGDGEYVSDTGSPDSQHYREHGAVNATIDWNIIVDPRYADAKSVETPYEINGSSVLEPETDGESKSSTIRYEKTVHFYEGGSGDNSVVTDDGSTDVVPMTGDGVEESVSSVGEFTLTVQNQANTQTGSGDGTANAG